MQAYARIFTAMAVKESGGAADVDDLQLGAAFGVCIRRWMQVDGRSSQETRCVEHDGASEWQ